MVRKKKICVVEIMNKNELESRGTKARCAFCQHVAWNWNMVEIMKHALRAEDKTTDRCSAF